MPRCPITYAPLEPGEQGYSRKGLRRLSHTLPHLEPLPYSAEEQRRAAARRATKMSIQGVQPKLSARLRPSKGCFEFVDRRGTYILKPPNPLFPHVPENEHLTMHLAERAGIEVPVHGLIRAADGSWTYFIKRFDRLPKGRKVATEDFAQLAGRTRETKYDANMEKVAALIERFTSFPVVEKLELLRRTLFCFLSGGEDMHLKNFSVITRAARVQLSPAYDLLNSTIVLREAEEELALPLKGKKRNLTRKDLLEYFARDRLGLPGRAVEKLLEELAGALPAWAELIDASFLPDPAKRAYHALLAERRGRLSV